MTFSLKFGDVGASAWDILCIRVDTTQFQTKTFVGEAALASVSFSSSGSVSPSHNRIHGEKRKIMVNYI